MGFEPIGFLAILAAVKHLTARCAFLQRVAVINAITIWEEHSRLPLLQTEVTSLSLLGRFHHVYVGNIGHDYVSRLILDHG